MLKLDQYKVYQFTYFKVYLNSKDRFVEKRNIKDNGLISISSERQQRVSLSFSLYVYISDRRLYIYIHVPVQMEERKKTRGHLTAAFIIDKQL